MTRNEEDELMGREMQKPLDPNMKLLQLENQVLKEQLARALGTLNYLLNSATPSQLEYNRALQEAQKSLKLEKVS